MHAMASKILMRFHEGGGQIAAALTVQLHKVLFQVGLDGGEWSTAILLRPLTDALEAEEYAGQPAEMLAAHRWQRARIEMRAKPTKHFVAAGSDDAEDERKPADSRKKQQRAKAKAKAGAAANP